MVGVFMAAGSLLLVAALLLSRAMHSKAVLTSPRPLLLLLLPPVVYLVARYARTGILVKLLCLCLLAASAFSVFRLTLYNGVPAWMWAEAAAPGLCAICLWLELRWARYAWYAIALMVAMETADLVRIAYLADWQHPTLFAALGGALLLLLVGGGGSVAVAAHFATLKPAPGSVPETRAARYRAAKQVVALCTAWALLVFAQWMGSLVADTEGIAGLHPTLKHWAAGGADREPFCDKITYCGDYVELSCHPEVDGSLSYYNNTNGVLVMDCGGACMNGQGPAGTTRCSVCPPPEWSSCTVSK